MTVATTDVAVNKWQTDIDMLAVRPNLHIQNVMNPLHLIYRYEWMIRIYEYMNHVLWIHKWQVMSFKKKNKKKSRVGGIV